VFESVGEATRGERSIEESERRLQQFAERVTQKGLGDRRQFKLKQSMQALETFLSLNLFILNVKKVRFGYPMRCGGFSLNVFYFISSRTPTRRRRAKS
jgi:hypothetical protein